MLFDFFHKIDLLCNICEFMITWVDN